MALNDLLVVTLASQAITSAVPLVLAGSGELVGERSGVINVGIDGLMLSGCIAGFAVTAATGSAALGLLAAVAAGMLLAGVFALVTVWGRADQIVAGLAINLVAAGGSGTLWQVLQAHGLEHLGPGTGFTRPFLPAGDQLAQLPLLGPLIFDQYALAYATAALVLGLAWVLRATRAGLVVQALGDAPDACATAGEPVRWWRTGCVLFAGGCAGAAGAYLSIMRTHGFVTQMTGGAGFVVLALVIFGRWRLGGLVLGSLAFGLLDSVQGSLQGYGLNRFMPYELTQALPYAVALVALVVQRRTGAGPLYLGRPYPER